MRKIYPLLYAALPLPLLLAGLCNPTHQACRQGEGPIVCDEGELPSCINHCFPTVPAAEAAGEACVVDPCDVDRVQEGDVILCPLDFACVPDGAGSRTGTCIPQVALSGCDLDGSPPCPTGTYCREFSFFFPPPSYLEGTAEGMCMPWVTEGSPCIEHGVVDRLQCEPGTYCRPAEAEGSPVWTCVRPCENDDDCPCAHDGFEPQCVGEGSSAPTCTSCVSLGAACEFEELAPDCCGEAVCSDFSDGVVGDERGLCCLPENAQCEDDSQCCGSNLCHEGSCEPCGGVGEMPPDAGCCDGLEVRGGVCSRDCVWEGELAFNGQPCDVPGAHETCFGKITCTPAGAECRPNSMSADNDCDGVDDDCDGVPDDDYPEPACTDTPPGCQSGFTPTTPGRERCEDTEEDCYYATGPRQTYCRLDSANSISGPGGCAVGPLATGCSSDSECAPGEMCGPGGSLGCGPGVAGCCESGVGGGMFVPCCRTDPSEVGTCWNPGDRG